MAQYAAKDIRRALIDLFEVLDAPIKQRDVFLDATLAAFPYVNGGLFTRRAIARYGSTSEHIARITATAQAILDARAKYPEASLADLYDENAMLTAHLRKHRPAQGYCEQV